MWHPASPKRWWQPRWACLRRSRQWWLTTAMRMTSIVWLHASRVSPKSFPMYCSASHEIKHAYQESPDERDQRRALHRRDAGVAGDFHGDRTDDESRSGRFAAGQQVVSSRTGAAGSHYQKG